MAGGRETLIDVQVQELNSVYEKAACNAFSGFPKFPLSVVRALHQRASFQGTKRRVVIEEVNPLAIERLNEKYDFDLVYLARHPMAIAQSFMRLVWWPEKRWDVAMKRIEAIETKLWPRSKT